ncbi:type II secretion system F family protein [Sulfurimonas sp. HSL-3221]|uniref:type II secretion system F family protein n=1 Tax=Thiomicrolovo sulfuroxydans TaxID=2894755 RepID=UPI001E5B9874|nr:type II secretion system F family protein [Sulfurimonas sp. HSL-3221]UFS62148.1 type II secretion system F family protein [Sulfurimonas sp. HSL-3221]
MVFAYRGLLQDGKKTKGVLEAADLEEAKKRLRSQGVFYTKLEAEKRAAVGRLNFSRKKVAGANELSILSRDLSIYIKSGISIVNALKLARNQYAKNKKMTNFLSSIITMLDEGKSFYQALERQNILALPEFYKQSIRVSEESGILQEVLLEMAIFLKEQDRISKQIKSAFAYPSFIIVVSIFMVAFMITFVVPKITGIFDQLDQELPPVTQFVIATGDFFTAHWIGLVVGIVALIGLFASAMKYNRPFRFGVHLLQLKLPFFGQVVQTSELGRFSYIASVLIRSGVPFAQTINLSANVLHNQVLQRKFAGASDRVVEGSKLSNALLREGFEIDPSFAQAIALGEETSEVTAILQNLSELYFEENKDKIGLFLSLLEPMLMLLVGGVIGFIVTAMLLPIFSMNIS